MKSLLQVRSLILFVLLTFFVLPDDLISQDKSFVGTKLLKSDGKVALQTILKENTSGIESLDDHFMVYNPIKMQSNMFLGEMFYGGLTIRVLRLLQILSP